jgi:hypothetical protein
LFAVLFFQNCTSLKINLGNKKSNNSLILAQVNSGNPNIYQGAQTGYTRLIPGHTCGQQFAAYEMFDVSSSTAMLLSDCDKKIAVPYTEIEFSKFSNNYLAYNEILYSYTTNLKDDINQNSFAEAWCQHTTADRSKNTDFEIGIHRQLNKKETLVKFYRNKPLPPVETSFDRDLNLDRIRYTNLNTHLDIQIKSALPGTKKFPGIYYGRMNGQFESFPVECYLGGQFDPQAPQMTYAENFKTFTLGTPVEDVRPSMNKVALNYSITPQLPEGLSLNSSTGEISGSPKMHSVRQNYTVSANFEFGEVTRTLSLGVGELFTVDPSCSAVECNFILAISRANALAPIPAVIRLTSSKTVWPGTDLLITGDIEIRGAGNIFDANKKTRHFTVNPLATLSLQDMTLKNGQALFGGSIKATSLSNLIIKRVNFENNQTTASEEGKGGAIFINEGSLSLTESQFISNSTRLTGTGQSGGAIYFSTQQNVSIKKCEFVNNSSMEGGTIYAVNLSNEIFEFSDIHISFGKALTGAGMYLRNGKFLLNNAIIEHNSAISQSGGLEASLVDRIWIGKSRFNKNTAQKGSALSFRQLKQGSNFYIYDSQFEKNSLNANQLLNFPEMRGSSLLLDGVAQIQKSNFINTSDRMNNCAKSSKKGSINSIGENYFDDSSCDF